jgi:hypothetical protein
MKATKITAANLEQLQAALDEAEGRATNRTLSAADVLRLVERAETETALQHLPRNMHSGATVTYRMRLNLPNSYKYAPEYTSVTITRRSTAWYLTRAERRQGNNKQAERITLTLTPEQSDLVMSRVRGQYSVSQAA